MYGICWRNTEVLSALSLLITGGASLREKADLRLLVTFYSVSSALVLESAGKARGFSCALIPVPRSISSSCGYAAETSAEDADSIAELLRELRIEWEAVYLSDESGYEPLYRN
jgi:hypothetical protein